MKRCLLCALLIAPLFLSGCVLDTIMGDFVNSGPKAVIDAKPDEGVAPLTVDFDAHYSRDSDGSIAEYHWEFGDPEDRAAGLTSQCSHTYQRSGTYIATLTVIDNEGITDSQQIAILVGNPPPVADFMVSNTSPLPGKEVLFNAAGSYDSDGQIADYHWDFGDGATGGGVTSQHTYTNGGYYVITLTLTDDEGSTASTRHGINVLPGQSKCADETTCGGGDPKPYAVIEAWPNPFSCSGGKVGQEIEFDASASRAGVGQIVSYAWDFGDGTKLSGKTAKHTFTKAGSFRITLTVVDSAGQMSTASPSARMNSTCQ